MRSFLFNISFYILTTVFALICVILSFLPGRKPIMYGLRAYTKTMMWLMRFIVGIKVHVSGREKIPDCAVIIASKHQSYGDGFVMFSQFFDLSFVTGDHLEKFMLLKRILGKAGAVVIDSCGGSDVRDRLTERALQIRKEGRKLLIYPEGHLSQIGTQHRYRKGVFFMYKDFDCPVIPVATNLGQRWNQNDWHKHAGDAYVEFLDPIPIGLEKDEFMRRLETAIETRSKELLDLENLGALNPEDIGKTMENDVARQKRLDRAEEKRLHVHTSQKDGEDR